MAKVTPEERENIRKDYLSLRTLGHSKTSTRQILSEKYDRGMTTIWDQAADLDSETPEVDKRIFKPEWPKSWIITSWELRVGVDEKFVECLKRMAEAYDAELLLVPVQASDARYAPDILKDNFHIVTEDIKFNSNIQLKYVETNALIQSPLAGHTGAYPDYTCIIPGLIKELRTEPSQHAVKQTISTGSVGYLNAKVDDYGENDADFNRKWRTVSSRTHGKPTAIAQNYVVPSAIIVDIIDEKTFLTRFVSSHRSGVVYDLNRKFTPDGFEDSTPSALIVGDTHALGADDDAIRATKEMIQMLNPREVVLNDFFDGRSINHHEIGNVVKFDSAPSLEYEAEVTKDLLTEFCNISNKVIYLQSNHENFITTFLSGPQQYWRLNRNYELAVELQLYQLKTGKHPIIQLLNLDAYKNLKFVTEKENHYVGKVLVKHGHEGVGGARVGFLSMAKIYNYYVQGHIHSPAVFRNAMMVGLTAELDQGYNVGGSAWLHANGIIQPDNSCQLLPIINSVWIK